MTLTNITSLFPDENKLTHIVAKAREADADRRGKFGWDPFVTCTFCGDSGMLPDSKVECHCEEGVKRATQRVRIERWPTLVPHKLRDYTLSAHPRHELADGVATWLASNPCRTGQNLVIQGPVGTGKTGAAIGALRELHFSGATVRYWFLPDLMDQLRSEEFERSNAVTMSHLLDCDVLLLDDAGKERNSRYVEERMLVIVNGRYTRNTPTILTSNIGDGWESYLGPAAASRINENVQTIKATGADLRKARR